MGPESVSPDSVSSDPLPPVGEERTLRGEAAQRALGERLARLPRGSVLFLEGPLGSGKTTLVQGIAAGLGFAGRVNSPTFALLHAYPTPQGILLHLDAYRAGSARELFDLGLEEQLEQARLGVIEWGETLYPEYPGAPVLRLEHDPHDPDLRRLTRLR